MADYEVRSELVEGELHMLVYRACHSFYWQGQRNVIRSEILNGFFGD